MKEALESLFGKKRMGMMINYLVYMLAVLIVQTMAITQFRPWGVCAFVLPAAVVAAGMFEGAVWGTLFGLLMGLITDMFFVESTITYTILFPCIAFATGFCAGFFLTRRFPAFMLSATAALLITGAVQMFVTSVYDVWSFSMIRTVLVQTAWSIPLSAFLYIHPRKWYNIAEKNG